MSSDRLLHRRTFLAALAGGFAAPCGRAFAADEAPLVGRPKGRPRIKLDRITLPASTPYPDETLRHLKFVLQREARRADWGTGSKSTISLRFTIETLAVEQRKNALHVRCSALGELPRRRTARSQLSYGGEIAQGKKLVFQVIEIVARGVIGRLADMERTRRSE